MLKETKELEATERGRREIREDRNIKTKKKSETEEGNMKNYRPKKVKRSEDIKKEQRNKVISQKNE